MQSRARRRARDDRHDSDVAESDHAIDIWLA